MTPTEQLIAAAKGIVSESSPILNAYGDRIGMHEVFDEEFEALKSALAAEEADGPLAAEWFEAQHMRRGDNPWFFYRDIWDASTATLWRLSAMKVLDVWIWELRVAGENGDRYRPPLQPQTTRAARKLLEVMGC